MTVPGILIVDDEVIIARELEIRLSKLGYDVRGIACSGEEAIRLAGETQPNLVLMDIVLKGGMDGIEAAAEIRKRWALPILYLSAYADAATVRRARIAQPFGYLVKPFSESELRANIEMALYKAEAESKLRSVEKWFAASMQCVADGVIATDRQGRVTFLNREAEVLTGRSSAEAVGQPLLEVALLASDAARKAIPDLIDRALAEGVVILPEQDALPFVRDGAQIRVDATACCLRDNDGTATGVVLVLRDQSACDRMQDALRRSEEDLRRKNAALAEANRRKDEFLAVLAHELRNPLVPIRNLVATLQRLPLLDNPTVSAACKLVDRQVDHLVHLVDDLLDVARINRGGLTVRKERCDLVEIVRQVAEAHRSVLEQDHGLTLTLDLPDQPMWAPGDRTRLIQVVGNLLHNARKFTPAGGTVEVSLAARSGQATLTVRDTGIGIAPELLPHIFEPFRQLAQALDRSDGGLGLGLTLVRHIVDQHGGVVEAESAGPGQGAAFTVRIPLDASTVLPLAEDRDAPAASKSRRVLLIEDNMFVAESTRLLIEVMGHSVRVATDGAKGLAVARSFRPEVVLCDIGLPGGMDGYAVARAFKQDPDLASACLVALSGYSQKEITEQCRAAGFDLYLTKPLEADELERVLASAVGEGGRALERQGSSASG
ncbi:MAG: response regulator [Methylocystis sp.]|nr:response regulator [Methylocystis sp.]